MIINIILKNLKLSHDFEKILTNIKWLLIDKGVRIALGLFVYIVVARVFGASIFGDFNYALAIVGVASVLISFGTQAYIVRELAKNPLDRDKVLGTAFICQFFTAVFLMINIFIFYKINHNINEINHKLVIILCLALIFKSTDVIRYWYESQVNNKKLIKFENILYICLSLLKITLLFGGMDVTALAYYMVGEAFLQSILIVFIYGREQRISWKFSLLKAKESIKFGLPLALSDLTIILYMRIDQILINNYLDSRAVGLFSAAVRISEGWLVLPMVVASSIFPSLVQLHAQDIPKYLDRLNALYRLTFQISLAVAIPLSLFSGKIIDLVYGPEFSGASIILAIHVWAGLFAALGVAQGKNLLADGKQLYVFIFTAAGLTTNVLLNLYFLPILGVIGAAISILVAQMAVVLIFPLVFSETRQKTLYMMGAMIKSVWRP